MAQNTSTTRGQLLADNVAVSVGTGAVTTLLDLPVADVDEVGIEVTPTTNAFDAFEVHGKFHPSGSYQTLYSSAGSFTSPVGLLIGASGDLTALAAASTGWLFIDTLPLYGLKVVASAAGGTATVTARAIGKARG